MSDHDPDSILIARVGRGDAAATRLLVAAKLPRIVGLATRILRNPSEAEDVAQEAFVRIWKTAGAWRPGRARFDTWLHTVVLNLCRDRLRRKGEITGDTLPDAADPSPDAESHLLESERSAAVANAISALPDRQREAIVLVHYQDFPAAEAAAVLDVSVDALESLLARGRRTLRRQLAKDQEGDECASH